MHPTLRDARTEVYWLADPARPARLPALADAVSADLAVVGGGYTGLWTALLAAERGLDVVLLEGEGCGDGASGRNGGFVHPSLTHGFGNGLARWPEEIDELDRLGLRNLTEIGETIERLGIDCDWHVGGEMDVALSEPELRELRAEYDAMRARGLAVEWFDRGRLGLASPMVLAGMLERHVGLVEPARLAWGLRAACLAAGVRIFESTWVSGLREAGAGVEVTTPGGSVAAARVALATNARRPLLRRVRRRIVPVYDYVLMSEPLTDEQWEELGWTDGYGLGDYSPVFVYSRTTRDRRILWGGYDAVYFYGSRTSPPYEARPEVHEHLAGLFRERFPQLASLRWDYRWAGVIDTCSRFSAFYGTSHRGKAAYAVGYTGLGVAASRFGAQVMLDLLAGESTERTRLRMVREQPLPFPPEPVRWAGISLTRRAMVKSARTGRRGPWLSLLDRLGLGFDS
jgi:glycine/D-amino acid oxidase-like deaminating enzyme